MNKLDTGEYEYRGFYILDTGGERSVHSRINRHSLHRWRVSKITGPGYFDKEPTRHSAPTFKEAKRRIDAALGAE